ncbi:MAG: 4-oxalomesaconate tautomerase [Halobacteriovoraceae bacterium]|nr:4-oxalomesaconate tautomerase [Halobacteriovoraceae bacterium]
MSEGIPCLWMRGGTSKGGYFLASDLPSDPAARDALLLRLMGSPDPRQIDGMGGGDTLTSKVAVVRPSVRAGVDVDYLFLQVFVDAARVSDAQNCGNILAGVGPFAIERGLVPAQEGETRVTIYMENTGQIAVARVSTPDGQVCYQGEAQIDGVPGTAAPVPLAFQETEGSSCGALFPTDHLVDEIAGIEVTLIDNGMPCVLMRAEDFGLRGDEAPHDLEADEALCARIENIRLGAGPLMHLGDVSGASVPKMVLLSPAQAGGAITTRCFIPHRCHKALGVFAGVSVATACLTPGTVAHPKAKLPLGSEPSLSIEHPTGALVVLARLDQGQLVRTEVLRTARKLMDGRIF